MITGYFSSHCKFVFLDGLKCLSFLLFFFYLSLISIPNAQWRTRRTSHWTWCEVQSLCTAQEALLVIPSLHLVYRRLRLPSSQSFKLTHSLVPLQMTFSLSEIFYSLIQLLEKYSCLKNQVCSDFFQAEENNALLPTSAPCTGRFYTTDVI